MMGCQVGTSEHVMWRTHMYRSILPINCHVLQRYKAFLGFSSNQIV